MARLGSFILLVIASLGTLAFPVTRPSTSQPTATPTTTPSTMPATLPSGTRITMQLKGVHPREAFAELAAMVEAEHRTVPRDLWRNREFSAIDIDVEDVSYWSALRELCLKVGLTPQRSGYERELVVGTSASRVWQNPFVCESGPFLIVAQSAYGTNQFDAGNPDELRRHCRYTFGVYAEPRVRVMRGLYNVRIEEAIDEHGHNIPGPPGSGAERMQPWSGSIWNVTATLFPQQGAGQRLSKLRGSVRMMIQTQSVSAEIADITTAKNVSRTVAGKRLLLKELKKNNAETYTLMISLFREASDLTMWSLINHTATLRLVDAEGRALTRRNYGGSAPSGDRMDLNLIYGKEDAAGGAAEPVKLIWEVPTAVAEVSVPFEFTELPLP